jgi:Flp pilus assembly protein protease CpaA
MLSAAIFSLSLLISWIDFRTHRIPNLLSVLLLVICLFNPAYAPIGLALLSTLLMSVIFSVTGVGMGDIKLAAILILTQGKLVLTIEYLNRFTLALSLTVIGYLFVKRTIKGSIALAPVLLLPYLTLYLDI